MYLKGRTRLPCISYHFCRTAFTRSNHQRDGAQGAGGTGWFLVEEESDLIIFLNESLLTGVCSEIWKIGFYKQSATVLEGMYFFLNPHMFLDGMGPCNKSQVAKNKESTFLNTCSGHQREILWWKARKLSSPAFMTFPTKNTTFHRNSKTKAMDFESLWAEMARRQLNDR